jgi:hypothetical protein
VAKTSGIRRDRSSVEKRKRAEKKADDSLLLVLFLFVVYFFVLVVLVIFFDFFADDRVLFVVIILVFIVGDHNEMDGMRLSNFELGVAFGAADDFSLFHFIFVEIKFGVAFRTSGHGGSLLPGSRTNRGLLYTASVRLSRNGIFGFGGEVVN